MLEIAQQRVVERQASAGDHARDRARPERSASASSGTGSFEISHSCATSGFDSRPSGSRWRPARW
jgi:hypothetical protein